MEEKKKKNSMQINGDQQLKVHCPFNSVYPVQQGLDFSLYYSGTFVKHLSLNK